MEEEFQKPVSNLKVMAGDVTLMEAPDIKARIKEAVYAAQAIWLDDFADLRKPLKAQEAAGSRKKFLKD